MRDIDQGILAVPLADPVRGRVRDGPDRIRGDEAYYAEEGGVDILCFVGDDGLAFILILIVILMLMFPFVFISTPLEQSISPVMVLPQTWRVGCTG